MLPNGHDALEGGAAVGLTFAHRQLSYLELIVGYDGPGVWSRLAVRRVAGSLCYVLHHWTCRDPAGGRQCGV